MFMDYLKVDGFVWTAMIAFRDTQISQGHAKEIH
jgi:hypothetical protein